MGVVVVPLLAALDILRMGRELSRGPDAQDMMAGVAVYLTFFGAPSILVAIGAYLHAARGKPAGRVMVAAGSLLLILLFLLFMIAGGYGALYLIGARSLLTLLSVLTWVASSRAPERRAEQV
jgi:uncharacterized membrane protein